MPQTSHFSVQVVRIQGIENLGLALVKAVIHPPSPSLYLVEAEIQSHNGLFADYHERIPGCKEKAGENGTSSWAGVQISGGCL